MAATLKLFKLQMDEKYDIFKTHTPKKILLSILKYIFFVAAITVVLYRLFKIVFMLGFRVNVQLLSVVILAIQLISFIFAIGNVVSALFLSKDNELLLSMPVTPNNLFISKVLVMYVQELIVSTLYALPLFLVLGLYGLGSLQYYLILPIVLLVLPLLPLSLAFLLAVPISFLIKFAKKHFLVSVIFVLVFAGVIFALYMNLLTSFSQSLNVLAKQIQMVTSFNARILAFASKNLLFFQLAKSFVFVDYIYYIPIYLIISMFILFLGTLIIKPFYFKSMLESPRKTAAKPKGFKVDTPFVSLVKKEIFTVLRSPNYVFQYFIFVFLMPFIVIAYDKLLLSLVLSSVGKTMVTGAHVLIVCIMVTLSNVVSASAFSREGANFYLIKTTPVNYHVQAFAKLAFNALFSLSALTLTTIITVFYIDVATVLLTGIVAFFVMIGHMLMSLDYDLNNPSLDWYDSTEVSTTSKNTFKSIFSGLVISLVIGFIIMFSTTLKIALYAWLVIIFLSAFFCFRQARKFYIRVYYKFDELEW